MLRRDSGFRWNFVNRILRSIIQRLWRFCRVLITHHALQRGVRRRLKSLRASARRRRFRSTTPGLVTRSTVRAEGVQLLARIEGDEGVLVTPFASLCDERFCAVLWRFRWRVAENYAEQIGLSDLKRANLEGGRSSSGIRSGGFTRC